MNGLNVYDLRSDDLNIEFVELQRSAAHQLRLYVSIVGIRDRMQAQQMYYNVDDYLHT